MLHTVLRLSYAYWVQLQRKCLGYGEDLRKIWELGVVELLGNRLTDKFVCILVENILKVLAGFEDVRWQVWVGAHPPVFSVSEVDKRRV
jgi:hypothetical protein